MIMLHYIDKGFCHLFCERAEWPPNTKGVKKKKTKKEAHKSRLSVRGDLLGNLWTKAWSWVAAGQVDLHSVTHQTKGSYTTGKGVRAPGRQWEAALQNGRHAVCAISYDDPYYLWRGIKVDMFSH